MKTMMAAICFALAVSPLVHAQDAPKNGGKKAASTAEKPKKEPTEKQKAQQERMKKCSADAKEKGVKGKEERSKFMGECMKG